MADPTPEFVAARTAILPLRDGGRILVRPLVPEDREELARAARRLSPRSARLRFFQPKDRLSEEELDYLTRLDYHDHFAWAAFDPDAPGRPGVGVARYVRLPGEPTVAEPAVTVLDDYQGRGIGTLLFGLLAATALEHGIETFRGYLLDQNLRLLDGVASRIRHDEPGVATVEIDLPLDDAQLDPAVRRLLASIASGEVRPRVRIPAEPPGARGLTEP